MRFKISIMVRGYPSKAPFHPILTVPCIRAIPDVPVHTVAGLAPSDAILSFLCSTQSKNAFRKRYRRT